MKNLKAILAASTAMALATAAWADSNEAYLDQSGTDNSALIEQSGSGAEAGSDGAGNSPGAMVQDGDENDIDILQTGGGTVGTGGNYQQNNDGIDQIGNRNELFIEQAGGTAATVREVQQTSTGATGLIADPAKANVTTILQNRGIVNSVEQTYTGDGTAGTENSVMIDQYSAGAFQRNTVGDDGGFQFSDRGVFQTGESNTVDITQRGTNYNRIRTVEQDGTNNSFTAFQKGGSTNLIARAEQTGTDNVASVDQDGTSNGNGAFTLGGYADLVGVGQSTLTQLGADNFVDYDAMGGYNLFGFYQNGTDNSVGSVAITGSGNETAASQTGIANVLNLNPIVGDDNVVGATQYGDDNLANIALTAGSDRNLISAFQESNLRGNEIDVDVAGDDNDLAIEQTVGASNYASSVADVDVTGNNNLLNIDQNSTRSGSGPHTVLVDITGDNNNRGSFDPLGDAFEIADLAGLDAGDMVQNRNSAFATITVVGNDNLFATSQSGNNAGSIDGTINGNANEAVVYAVGTNNAATFSQTGTGNNLGIMQ